MDASFLTGFTLNNQRLPVERHETVSTGYRARTIPGEQTPNRAGKPWRPDAFIRRPEARPVNDVDNPDFMADNADKITQGMTVEHQRFGTGKILKVEGVPPNRKATVFFQNAGTKQLLLKFARLRIKDDLS
jgi:DNA helicase II / ATP-dependent DNA helicase PcrA